MVTGDPPTLHPPHEDDEKLSLNLFPTKPIPNPRPPKPLLNAAKLPSRPMADGGKPSQAASYAAILKDNNTSFKSNTSVAIKAQPFKSFSVDGAAIQNRDVQAHPNLVFGDFDSKVTCSFKPTMEYCGKKAILFQKSDKLRLINRIHHVLIGKFSHGRPPMSAIKDFFCFLKLKGSYNISLYDSKHIYIECDLFEDFIRIWLEKIWIVKGSSMRVFKWSAEFNPKYESPVAPVWVHLYGLPLYLFEKEALMSIANAIGYPLYISRNNINRSNLSYASLCVELDVTKPLLDEVWIDFGKEIRDSKEQSEEKRDGFWQRLSYGSIPSYCVYCSHIDHSMEFCKQRKEMGSGLVCAADGTAQAVGTADGNAKIVYEGQGCSDHGSAGQGCAVDALCAGQVCAGKECADQVSAADAKQQQATVQVCAADAKQQQTAVQAADQECPADEFRLGRLIAKIGDSMDINDTGQCSEQVSTESLEEGELIVNETGHGVLGDGTELQLQEQALRAAIPGSELIIQQLDVKTARQERQQPVATKGSNTDSAMVYTKHQIDGLNGENHLDCKPDKVSTHNKATSALVLEDQEAVCAGSVNMLSGTENIVTTQGQSGQKSGQKLEYETYVKGGDEEDGGPSGVTGNYGEARELADGKINSLEQVKEVEDNFMQGNKESWADRVEKAEEEGVFLENTLPVVSQNEDSEEDEINGTLTDLHKQVMGLKSSKKGPLVEEEEKQKYKKQDIRITSQLRPSEVKDCAKKELAKVYSTPTSSIPSLTNLQFLIRMEMLCLFMILLRSQQECLNCQKIFLNSVI